MSERSSSVQIHCEYWAKPVPDRSCDWCVYDENMVEDVSTYGWGATKLEACADFFSRLQERAA